VSTSIPYIAPGEPAHPEASTRHPGALGIDAGLPGYEESGDMSALRPRIQTALLLLDTPDDPAAAPPHDYPGSRILDAISERVTRLQDAFMDELGAALEGIGVDGNDKLTLCLDDNARLTVKGEHPHGEALNSLLAARPRLSEAFTEIAVQSALLRDLRNLQQTALHASSEDNYMALAATHGGSLYQLSLKGDMNHFYFTR
jgi:hypothetical protein